MAKSAFLLTGTDVDGVDAVELLVGLLVLGARRAAVLRGRAVLTGSEHAEVRLVVAGHRARGVHPLAPVAVD